MSRSDAVLLQNGEAIDEAAISVLPGADFFPAVLEKIGKGARACAYFGRPINSKLRLYAVLADEAAGQLALLACDVEKSFPSLTAECPQLHLFEREIAEQFGVHPAGHPWLRPVRFPKGRSGAVLELPEIGSGDFYTLKGEEVHEVAVGPVHAGVIEPGHFRFQCHGERVFHLEISLGYQHRGIEEALLEGPHKISLHQMETVAGDTTIGHALAYCQTVEALGNGQVPARAQALRGVALELERLANHVGDLGALAQDVAYLPAASFCGRIRGDFLNLTALLCGSRLGRGFIRPGGVGFDLEEKPAAELTGRLEKLHEDLNAAVELLWKEPSVISRFENTGVLPKSDAEELGLVGPPARASGIGRDVRRDFAFGIYRFFQLPVVTASSGDVFARAFVRWREIQQSLGFVLERLANLPPAAPGPPPGFRPGRLLPRKLAVSLVEGWRGEICHVAITGADGKFARYKIIDPSFHNWFGLAMALRGGQISDFPLGNKSFNLSYCGHDL